MNTLTIVLFLGLVVGLLLAQPHKLTLRARQSFRSLLADTRGAIPFEQVSKDAQTALTEFNESFMLALAQTPSEPWAAELGFSLVSDALRTKFPIPVSAAGYREFQGDIKYRSLFERSVDVIPRTWVDGVAELAKIIEAPDFIGWAGEPERMSMAALTLENELIGQLLASNPASWEANDGSISFLHSVDPAAPSFTAGKHPYNIFDPKIGGFDNDFTGATLPSHQNLQIAKTRFRRLLAANGKPLGLRLTHILAPPAQEEIWRNILEQDLIIQALPLTTTPGDGSGTTFGAVNNRHKGTVKLVIADELGGNYTYPDGSTGSDLKWYPLALNKAGAWPWASQKGATPEVIIRDKSSDFYKSTLKVSYGSIIEAGFAPALSQLIQRWAGTAS